MAAPFAPISYILIYLELVGDTLNFEHPFLLANAALYDGIGCHFCFHLPREVVMRVVSSEFHLFVDHVIIVFVGMDDVGQIGATVKVVAIDVIWVVVPSRVLRTDDRFFESKLVLDRNLRQFEQQLTDALPVASLDLRRSQVHIDAQLLQLQQNVLTGSLGVIVLAPVLHLVVV